MRLLISDGKLGALWALTGLAVPLSVKLYLPYINLEVIFPAEPLIGLLFLLHLTVFVFDRRRYHPIRSIWKHPVVVMAISWALILILSTLFSVLPIVSAKALMVQLIYVSVFAIVPVIHRVNGIQFAETAFRWHDRAFMLVILFTLTAQSIVGFDRVGANYAPFPFYTDHTVFAAALTFVLFRKVMQTNALLRSNAPSAKKIAGSLAALAVGFTFLVIFCRAAWLGVMIATGLVLLLRIGLSLRHLMIGGACSIIALISFHEPLLNLMRNNQVDSQQHHTGYTEALLSVTNITTDTSNRDRISRWIAAWRMFNERKWSGHGPGTYQFIYKDHLSTDELGSRFDPVTVPLKMIVPAWSADDQVMIRHHAAGSPSGGGTAHSEYLLGLAEKGIPSLLWWVTLGLLVVYHTALLFGKGPHAGNYLKERVAALALLAYLSHAFVNNYLDDCKVAMLFWFAMVMLLNNSPLVKTNMRTFAHGSASNGTS